MFVALTTDGNRIHASEAVKGFSYVCQECGQELHLRGGPHRRLHFAHLKENKEFEHNPDYNHEWHIRMQNYFPRENQEVRFVDDRTGEVHIADIYLPDSKTVLEFQHSPITDEEFQKRSAFHINNGRRIVWLFDESSVTNKYGLGKFKPDNEYGYDGFKWMGRRRKFLEVIEDLKKACPVYSVCVYLGTEGDVFHRIINQHFGYEIVEFSRMPIEMTSSLDPDIFFQYDEIWQREDISRQLQLHEFQTQLRQSNNIVRPFRPSKRKARL